MSGIQTISQLENHLRQAVVKAVTLLGVQVDETLIQLVAPPKQEMGDIAVPCFPFAKVMKKAPQQIAGDIASQLQADEIIEQAEAAGPYLNFRYHPEAVSVATLKQVDC